MAISIQKKIINELLEENKQKDNIIAICIFGSVAESKERNNSDVDIQIIYNDDREWELFKKEKYNIKIDYEIVTTKIIEMLVEKYPYLSYGLLYLHKILYDPTGFMIKIQEKLKKYYDIHPEVKDFWKNEYDLMRQAKNSSLKPRNLIDVCDEAELKFSGYNKIRRNILNKEFFRKHIKESNKNVE